MRVTSFGLIGAVALALLAMRPAVARAGDAARASRDLLFAKSAAESEKWDDFDQNMKKAAADMEGLSDAEKAPLLAQIAEAKAMVTKSVEEEVTRRLDKAAKAEPGTGKLDIDRATARLDSDEAKTYADPAAMNKLRARIASMTGAPAPTPAPATPVPPTTPQPAMSGDLATAAARVRTARSMLEQGDRQIADSMVRQAFKLLEGVPDRDKAPVLADIDALNKQIDEADLKARRDEEYRRMDEQVHRYVGTAESSIQEGVVCDPEWIDKSEQLLASHDVKTYMDADQIKQYQTRLDAVRARLKTHNKEVALARSAANLKELEERVAADPFKGVSEQDAHKVFNDLKTLSDRVRAEFARVPKDDPEIKAALDRVAAANARIEASESKWAIEKMQDQFATSWRNASQAFAGWEAERPAPDSASRRIEGLNKTMQAVSGTVYWLNTDDTKQTIAKYKDNPAVQTTAQAARQTLDAASAKLNDAFNEVLAEAERKPMPTRESARAEIGELGRYAGNWLAGTKYKDADVARAAALDAKWKADVARAEKEMEANLKKLTAEANAAWPKIEASVGADKGFDPADAGNWKGKTIEIKGYYNRSGWDFDSAYDFAAGIKGIPVAGHYDPHVREAFNEGSRQTRFGIDDHVGWDVIAIVEGPGKINRRVTTNWRAADTHELIMKTESLVPEPCVVIKIIGLRAGPVAVGPK
jgi:hypothetical protein